MPKRDQKRVYFVVVGTNFGLSVAVGLLLGGYLDDRFDNETPYFTILGIIVGLISGIVFLVRVLNLRNKNDR